jgi:hypothetical protein
VPSVVALHEGQLYVGEGAKDLRARIGDFGLEQSKNIFWDCKNDIGIRRTYHKAPPGFQSAKAALIINPPKPESGTRRWGWG